MSPRTLLAAAFLRATRQQGFEAPPTLRLLAGPPATSVPEHVAMPEDLGPLHERLVGAGERNRRGAWYTPMWLAADLVARAVPDASATDLGPVVDPACGGGVFLLAAAERLVQLGLSPERAIAALRGLDVDPLAVGVTEAALWWWGARRGVDARADIRVGDALLEDLGPSGTVVGNPPFLGQLRTATAVDARRRAALQERWGSAMRPYTDAAWLFVLAAVEQVAVGGHVALVQPQSFLAARDAAAVRERIDGRADLVHTVVDARRAFDANVQVCSPVLRRRAPAASSAPNDWVGALADAAGVPPIQLAGARRLGDVASIHAGFRDEYYGMVEAVGESVDHAPEGIRLVTAGGIDPCRLLGRPQRFAGRRWSTPVVDVTALAGRAARWAEVQSGPKVLVATQTKVIEAVADPEGTLLGSVPVLSVVPEEPDRIWHVLAALHAPAASAWLFRRSAGTALSADACRPTVALLSALPLPEEGPAWDRAATSARDASRGEGGLAELGRHADAAYGLDDPELLAWWDHRRPRR